jgi:hypothetical protein
VFVGPPWRPARCYSGHHGVTWDGAGQRITVRVEYGVRSAQTPILLLDAALIVVAASQDHHRGHALVEVLAAGWATGFRYPASRLPGRAGELTAGRGPLTARGDLARRPAAAIGRLLRGTGPAGARYHGAHVAEEAVGTGVARRSVAH